MTKSVEIWVTQRHAIAFLKSVKHKSNLNLEKKFLEEKQTNLTIKLHYETTQKIIQKKKKGIIEVYFEFLETNFYAQISCSGHAKFAKIIFILMHRIAISVFVYISFPTSTKNFCLAVPQTQDKNNGPAQFRTTTANSKSKWLF